MFPPHFWSTLKHRDPEVVITNYDIFFLLLNLQGCSCRTEQLHKYPWTWHIGVFGSWHLVHHAIWLEWYLIPGGVGKVSLPKCSTTTFGKGTPLSQSFFSLLRLKVSRHWLTELQVGRLNWRLAELALQLSLSALFPSLHYHPFVITTTEGVARKTDGMWPSLSAISRTIGVKWCCLRSRLSGDRLQIQLLPLLPPRASHPDEGKEPGAQEEQLHIICCEAKNWKLTYSLQKRLSS